jgi:indolepyruvate ferredoxin oxidoreductase beta subunit
VSRLVDSTSLIITGVGGQGNVLAARLLASALLAEGYEVTVGDVYGLTQRGGSVASHMRWIKGRTPLPPLVPQNSLDILVAFEPLEGLRVLTQFGKEGTVAIVNDTPVMPIGVQSGRFAYPDLPELLDGLRDLTREIRLVDATSIAQKLGNVQALNMVLLGALLGSGFISLGIDVFEKTLESLISKTYFDINLLAFRQGIDLTKTNH